MGLSCEAGSLPCHLNPHKFLQPEVLSLYFPALDPWVVGSVSLPSCSSQFICPQMWDCPLCQPPPCCKFSLPHLPVSAPPIGLDECFFFNSLVVRLQYSSVFSQFWLLFIFKSVVVLLLVVWGSTVYLPMPPPWPEVGIIFHYASSTPWERVTAKKKISFEYNPDQNKNSSLMITLYNYFARKNTCSLFCFYFLDINQSLNHSSGYSPDHRYTTPLSHLLLLL